MNIVHSPIEKVVERGPQPHPARLSFHELIMCFPREHREQRAPAGCSALRGAQRGREYVEGDLCRDSFPSRTDRDGAYRLSLQVCSHGLVLKEQWKGDEISVAPDAYRDALVTWRETLFSSALRTHPSLARNENFAVLKGQTDEQLSGCLPKVQM